MKPDRRILSGPMQRASVSQGSPVHPRIPRRRSSVPIKRAHPQQQLSVGHQWPRWRRDEHHLRCRRGFHAQCHPPYHRRLQRGPLGGAHVQLHGRRYGLSAGRASRTLRWPDQLRSSAAEVLLLSCVPPGGYARALPWPRKGGLQCSAVRGDPDLTPPPPPRGRGMTDGG